MMIEILFLSLGIIAVICLLMIVFHKFWFLRNPVRRIPPEDAMVSACDGKVIEVRKLDDVDKLKIPKGIIGRIKTSAKDVPKAEYLVSVFMSPFDVHYIRMPYTGEVVGVKHQKGKFLAANSLEAFRNEKTEVLLKTAKGRVKVIMIAGFLARRTISFVKKKDKLLKGQHLGLINLGSQTSLILPKGVKPVVKKGQRVKAGETIIARFR